ncbi:hypothetical protein EYW49_15360 [Siculibacillus lacustris]|uniref:Uncharacterized protein n=1 Tax=Siculibacillus lacustris TaxID=1549641 RepID=A0A4V2KT53_9HYPH|nr:hypothetical protein [Siculibacillus lacustris]TBW35772.1 hypothetical protein EYW49_15360 [Siculibacillus lacustris]
MDRFFRFGLIVLATASLLVGRAQGGNVAAPVERHGSRIACLDLMRTKDIEGENFQADEAACFATGEGLLKRTGDDLEIRIAGSAPLVLKGDLAACDAGDEALCRFASVDCFDPIRRFVIVNVGYYEMQNYEFINLDDGSRTTIYERPEFSPAGDQFIVISRDIMNERPVDLAVFQIEGGHVKEVFEYNSSDFTPPRDETWSLMSWLDEDHIALSVAPSNPMADPGESVAVDLVKDADGEWRLQDWPR